MKVAKVAKSRLHTALGQVKIRIKYLALQSAAIRIIYGKYVYLRFSYARKKIAT